MDAHMTNHTKPAGVALQTPRAPYLYSTMGWLYEGKELQYRGRE